MKDSGTEKPYYAPLPISDLSEHIEILPLAESTDKLEAIESVTQHILDTRPYNDKPAWKIVVLPLKCPDSRDSSRCFIAFSFSHAVGDGISGLAFHKSFLAGLQDPLSSSNLTPADGAMPEPFDTKKNLPISLSYLLAPALGQYLPKFISRALGMRAAVSTTSASTWLGNGKVFFDENDHRSGARIFKLDGAIVSKLVEGCREHDTKLTSLLHQIIIHALSTSLSADDGIDNFASQTAINMRHHVDVPNDTMGLYVTGFFDVHPRTTDMGGIWQAAKEMNERLYECSSRLENQSIGLLRYLISMRSWTEGKLGGPKDSSYELSNLLAFDPGAQPENPKWALGNMVFAQPANVTGSPLVINVVARKEADLVCTITWQIGALGIEDERAEYAFVDKVIEAAVKCASQIASM